MASISALRLRIVPLDRILLHEAHDPARVERMMAAVRQDGYLRNPVIVTQHEGRYVQLDGATRTIALGEMGMACILVQIVGYQEPEVRLSGWNHVLIGFPAERVCALAADLEGLRCRPCEPEEIEPALRAAGSESAATGRRTGEALLGVIDRQGGGMLVQGSGDLRGQLRHLSTLVALYRGQAEVRRAAEAELEALLAQHPDLSAVVAFPQFSPQDVVHCALNRMKLPMGITRHLIDGRALGVDVPLELLSDRRSLEEKNTWLEQMILERIRRNKVRVYQEPVIVFDD